MTLKVILLYYFGLLWRANLNKSIEPIIEANLLFGFIPNQDFTLQYQFHRFLIEKIENGTLPPATKLPPSRQLAKTLHLSRNTVTHVFDQLKAEGYLTTRQGSGTYINAALPTEKEGFSLTPWHVDTQLPGLSTVGKRLQMNPCNHDAKNLPFTSGVPDHTVFPEKIWQRLQRRHADRKSLKGYGGGQGYSPLRYALANYLKISRGVLCDADQIIVTQGAQQAITLCALLLLNEGDEVLMENPGYANARRAFQIRQAKLKPLSIGSNGIDINSLPKKTQAKLMYTTPTHQYPLGGIQPAAARLALLDWAASMGTWIIEDDYDSEFHFHGKPIAAIQGMAKKTPVIYIGSFSKTIYPALRLGYMVVPKELVGTFTNAKAHLSGEAPLLSQAIVSDFITEGHFIRHLRKVNLIYQKKWDHTQHLVKKHLEGLATPIAESAGMHIALEIQCRSDTQLEAAFAKQGYGGSALSSYYLPDQAQANSLSGLVLGFACTNTQERESGIKILREIVLNNAF